MRTKLNSVAFTGYRPDKIKKTFATTDYEQVIIDSVRVAAVEFYKRGARFFLCGMAEGFDLLCADVIMELRSEGVCADAEVVAVIPYPGFECGFDEKYQRLYYKVLESAVEKITVCEHYFAGCYNLRNDYLVDNASAVICCYDGQSGGTAYTVRRARKSGRTIYNILNPVILF